MHHYPSLSTLLAHALDVLYDDFVSTAKGPSTSITAAIEAVWSAVGDPRFKAVFEAWFAATNDRELAAEISPSIARFAKVVSPESANKAMFRDEDARAFFLVAREAMLGMALGRATSGGRPLGHEATVMKRLRADAADYDNR